MANAVYDLWKDLIASAGLGLATLDLTAATLKVAAIDTGVYTFSQAHEDFADVSGVIGTPVELTSPTVTGKTIDAANATFTDLDGTSIEALLIYMDTGVAGTSPLVAFIDTGVTGLPLTTDGEATVAWDAAGIFDL